MNIAKVKDYVWDAGLLSVIGLFLVLAIVILTNALGTNYNGVTRNVPDETGTKVAVVTPIEKQGNSNNTSPIVPTPVTTVPSSSPPSVTPPVTVPPVTTNPMTPQETPTQSQQDTPQKQVDVSSTLPVLSSDIVIRVLGTKVSLGL